PARPSGAAGARPRGRLRRAPDPSAPPLPRRHPGGPAGNGVRPGRGRHPLLRAPRGGTGRARVLSRPRALRVPRRRPAVRQRRQGRAALDAGRLHLGRRRTRHQSDGVRHGRPSPAPDRARRLQQRRLGDRAEQPASGLRRGSRDRNAAPRLPLRPGRPGPRGPRRARHRARRDRDGRRARPRRRGARARRCRHRPDRRQPRPHARARAGAGPPAAHGLGRGPAVTTDETAALADRLLAGSTRALARGLTWIKAGQPRAEALSARLYPHTGRSPVIGLTGSPGSGKTTLARALATAARARGLTVGIVAVDPSSPYSGGAILGDRIRMNDLALDPGVFIRSMATRGALGGLCRAAADAVDLLDAAGWNLVVAETVGVGQDEVDVMRLAHTVVVVSVPGLGDDIQALKAGLLEIADIHVVNKAGRAATRRPACPPRPPDATPRPTPAPAGSWPRPRPRTEETAMADRDEAARAAAMRRDWEDRELRQFLERQPEARAEYRTASGL